ncbi:hypothetical protein ACHAPJ_009047 [Fusarium lateritium]
MSAFQKHFQLDEMSTESLANWDAWITSILMLGSFTGSLISAPLTDKLGRRWSLGASALLYCIAAIMMAANPGGAGGRVELLVGRFLSGAGSGAASVIGTGYTAEIAPKSIRGGLTALYNANTMLSVGLAYWVNFGSLLHIDEKKNMQWQVPMGVQALPGVILLVALPFIPESPRWLLSCGKTASAETALEHLRSLPKEHDYLRTEFEEINSGIDHERSLAPGWSGFLAEVSTPNIRKRLILDLIMQVGFQFSGGNIITYYNTSILQSIGFKSHQIIYLFSGIYGLVKFCSVLFYCLFIIDRLGRRQGLFIGSSLILVSLVYISAFLGVSELRDGQVPKAAAWVAVVFIYIFAIGYAFSWGTAPWIINAEVFPSSVRSILMALCVAWQYLVNFALSRGQPNMVLAMHSWGPFCLFACFTSCTTFYCYFAFPETRGLSMDHMDKLFDMPWDRVGPASIKIVNAENKTSSRFDKPDDEEISVETKGRAR